MFGFGVFLCHLAVPTPLVVAVLGAPLWEVVLIPAGLFVVGLACMGIGDAIDWGPPVKDPTMERLDALLAEARELNDQLRRTPRDPRLRARFRAVMAEAEGLLQGTSHG